MGVRTGNPRGRPKGAKNKRTVEGLEKAGRLAEAISATMPGAFDGDAHALLMTVYRNPEVDMDLRVRAATSAIRYEKPALSSVEANLEGGGITVIVGGYKDAR